MYMIVIIGEKLLLCINYQEGLDMADFHVPVLCMFCEYLQS